MNKNHMTSAAIAVVSIATFVLPVFASAATVSNLVSPTQQLLPRGANTCAPLQVQSVNPYVYNGSLDSFDVTVTDASYVSVIGSVGDAGIPLSFMTRRINADGALRIHVDIQSTPVAGTLPVSLTLLSAPSGKPLFPNLSSRTCKLRADRICPRAVNAPTGREASCPPEPSGRPGLQLSLKHASRDTSSGLSVGSLWSLSVLWPSRSLR